MRCWHLPARWHPRRAHLKRASVALCCIGLFFCTRAWSQENSGDFGVFHLNVILSNAPVYQVLGLPTVNAEDTFADGFAIDIEDSASVVLMDGSGKISGVAMVSVTTDTIVDSTLILNVTGSMGTKGAVGFGVQGTASTVQITLSGKGFATDGTNAGKASLALRFSGEMATAGDGTPASEVDGAFSGVFQPGIRGVKATAIRDASATISSADLGSMSEVEVDGSVTLFDQALAFSGQIITPLGLENIPLEGAGTLDPKNTFRLSLDGATPPARGSVLNITSRATDNPFTSDLGVSAITSLSATGKVLGQKVKTDSFDIGITPGP